MGNEIAVEDLVEVYWLLQNAIGVPEDDAWLGEGERGTLAGLRIAKRRADWRLGRWTAKLAIAAYRRLPPRSEALAVMEIRPAPSGAPVVFWEGQPADVAISLSHSHGVGFCVLAASGTDLGCDVELVEARSPAFVRGFFTDEEVNLVLRSPAADRDQIATLLWSAKESALKAVGCGLRSDTRRAVVEPASWPAMPASSPAFPRWSELRVRFGGRVFAGWWCEDSGFVFTIVAEPAAGESAALDGAAGHRMIGTGAADDGRCRRGRPRGSDPNGNQ